MYAHRLSFDTIDRQRDRTKKLYRMLKEPLGTTKQSSEQSKDFIGYSKRCAIACIKKKLDEMGHLHLLLDEMGLDEMGINQYGVFFPSDNQTIYMYVHPNDKDVKFLD